LYFVEKGILMKTLRYLILLLFLSTPEYTKPKRLYHLLKNISLSSLLLIPSSHPYNQ